MAKKKQETVRTCADCIHEFQCQMWNMGNIHNMDATRCNGYETVKDSAAYLCGVLDERKRKRSNAERVRAMSDEELTTFLNQIVTCHQLRREGYCERCPLHGAKPCDTEGIIDWLKQPAE